jgi:glutathione S-transferase
MHIDHTTLVLHHYDGSPYAEKVRFVLGAKSARWVGVTQPMIMPKPELTLLTGGYRRIPVLQVGADIYLDTRLILAQIERRVPDPPMAGGHAELLQIATDRVLFQAVVTVVFSEVGRLMPPAFLADRQALAGGRPLDPAAMASTRPHALSQLRATLCALSRALGDQVWLGGVRPTFADAHAWFLLWFLKRNCPDTFRHLIDGHPALIRWTEACAALGHGRHAEASPADAVEAARRDLPDPIVVSDGFLGEPGAGERVTIAADDYGRDPIEGTLVRASDDEFVVRRLVPGIGPIDVHAPRLGFVLARAQ